MTFIKKFSDVLYVMAAVLICAFLVSSWLTWHRGVDAEISKIQQMENEHGAEFTRDYYMGQKE